jgi:hypothetical protein
MAGGGRNSRNLRREHDNFFAPTEFVFYTLIAG